MASTVPQVIISNSTAPTAVNVANTYLLVGNKESTLNSYRAIGFGTPSADNFPAYLAYKQTSAAGSTTGQFQFLTRSVTTDTAPNISMVLDESGNIVLQKTAGVGIKIDTSAGNSTYPWRDMLGSITLLTGGATVPTRAAWQGNIYAVSFDHATATQEVFTEYHFGHDYVMASDIHVHSHWSTIVTATGNVNWLYDLCYGKGYNQGAMEGTVGTGLPVTLGVTQAGSTAFWHQIAEVQCSTPGGLMSSAINVSITSGAAILTAASSLFTAADEGKTVQIVGAGAAGAVLNTTITTYTSATQVTVADNAGTTITTLPNFRWRILDSNLFEPDGLILCRTWHKTNRTADTLTQIPFLHYVDCHYQSTEIGTKQKNGPAFWT